jgi:hypothetical protein
MAGPNNTQSYIDLLNDKSIRATEPDLYAQEEIQERSGTIDRRKFEQLDHNIFTARVIDPCRTHKHSRELSLI